PNFLLMDEPTTHLDMASIDALIYALNSYEGTLVFISHDVHFIKQIAKNVLHVHSGRLTPYAGNYDYYLEKSKATNERAALTAGFTDGRPTQAKAEAAKPVKPVVSKANPAEIKKLKSEVSKLEQQVAELEAKQAKLMKELSDPATYTQGARVQELNVELKATNDALAAASAQWEESATRFSQVQS
ncbi:MAG: ABC transporter ATP-binding protein, partial [bacterium]